MAQFVHFPLTSRRALEGSCDRPWGPVTAGGEDSSRITLVSSPWATGLLELAEWRNCVLQRRGELGGYLPRTHRAMVAAGLCVF